MRALEGLFQTRGAERQVGAATDAHPGRKQGLMATAEPMPPDADPGPRCQAQPLAARRGFRDDVLCASIANSSVDFRGRPVAVCRIHLKMYVGWGTAAEQHAARLWAWPPEPTQDPA